MYKRQRWNSAQSEDDYRNEEKIHCYKGVYSVSYTHLDVYKRQIIHTEDIEHVMEQADDLIKGRRDRGVLEFRIIRRDQRVTWIRTECTLSLIHISIDRFFVLY